MKLFFVYILAVSSFFLFIDCQQYKKNIIIKRTVKSQYEKLCVESDKFLGVENQKMFLLSLNKFLVSFREYNFTNGRKVAHYLNPVIINSNHTKAIILILKRGYDMSGNRVEYLKFVSAKFANNQWSFKLAKGYTLSFSYRNREVVSLSDEELSMEAIKKLMSEGYFKSGKVHDELIFNSYWYNISDTMD